jgi:hypothetical protein
VEACVLHLLTVGFLAASLQLTALAGQPPEEPTVPTDPLAVRSVGFNGAGCAEPTEIFMNVAEDNGSLTVTFGDRYRAAVGVGSLPTDLRKNCSITLMLDVPVNYTYAIVETEQTGNASIMEGTNATHRWSTYASGAISELPPTYKMIGPYDGFWTTSHLTAPAAMVWHPCNEQRTVNLNTELKVNVGTSDPATTASYMSLRSSTYRLVWQACPTD